jgi:hypothetical protein
VGAATTDIFQRARQFERGRGIQHASKKDLLEMFRLAGVELSAICDGLLATGRNEAEPSLRLTEEHQPPATMDRFANQCLAEFAALTAEFSDVIVSAMVGGTPGCEFDYRVYFIIGDNSPNIRLISFFDTLRNLFGSSSLLSSRLWRIRCPIVLTLSMWKKSSLWYHALRPIEESYFVQRHGQVLAGEDLRELPDQPSEKDLFRSAAQSVCATCGT